MKYDIKKEQIIALIFVRKFKVYRVEIKGFRLVTFFAKPLIPLNKRSHELSL